MPELEGTRLRGPQLALRGAVIIIAGILLATFLSRVAQFDVKQITASTVFLSIVLATLMFWRFRLAIAFLGVVTLLGFNVLSLSGFIESCELDIIIFLVGMMVVVGVLRELGFFTWVIQRVISIKTMSGPLFVVILVFLSAIMACIVDEVTSIVFICALVFQICETLKVRPLPFLMIAVMATNIGSSGTMMGNPVGLLIGLKGGLTFEHFLVWAFPVMMVTLILVLLLLMVWYRKDIADLSEKLKERREMGLHLGPLVRVPCKRSISILAGMIVFIVLHHRLEGMLGLERNTILIMVPIATAGLLMIWRNDRARQYIEHDVEWWTLLFFMMLFANAGALAHTGVTTRVAQDFSSYFAGKESLLTPVIIIVSALGSAFVDNVVFVAAFIPVVRELNSTPLWWALLFGACFGGNITMIGSTANIVALGILEKRSRAQITFFEWLRVGIVVGIVSCLIAWAALAVLAPYMPDMEELHAHGNAVELDTSH